DLVGGRRLGVPVQQGLDVIAGDVLAILKAQQILQQDLQGEGQACCASLQRLQAEDFVVLGTADQGGPRLERVFHASSARNGKGSGPQPWGPETLRNASGAQCIGKARGL